MKQYVIEEIAEIENKMEEIAEKISKGAYSAYGQSLGIEIIKILGDIVDYLKSAEPSNTKVDEIITRMPLLYLQINKIN